MLMDYVVVKPGEEDVELTDNDKEMDRRAKEAVRAAIKKAKFLNQPIAKYDKKLKKVYIKYSNGRKEYRQ